MLRLISYLFLLAGLAALGNDVRQGPLEDAPLEFTTTAQHWTEFSPDTLARAQSFVETSLSPDLWQLAILPAISWPAFVLFIIIGLILMVVSKRGHKNLGREGLILPKSKR